MEIISSKPKLWTSSFVFCCLANFLMFFSFYILLPTMPFYLKERFMCSGSSIGLILSSYSLMALLIRPFSGYLVDTFARKPFYLLAMILFCGAFIGYGISTTIGAFVLFRSLHGVAFGTSSVSGSTMVIDILPSSRRGEGLGYYGLSNNLAMAFGPMLGMFLYDHFSFQVIFTTTQILSLFSLLAVWMIKTSKRPSRNHEPLSLDRFVLLKGIPAGICLLLLSIPYGMTTSYVAMYGKELGLENGTGIFFSLMAVGIMLSRLISGKRVDRGEIPLMIKVGMSMVVADYALLGGALFLLPYLPLVSIAIYFGSAFFIGCGFGMMFPAFNTLFVNLAPNSMRGTASSTYLTSWDVGIGLGVMLGGSMGQWWGSFSYAYLFGFSVAFLSLIYFIINAAPHFLRNKLR